MPATAFREGVIAAKSGDDKASNPHIPDSEQHAAWKAGYGAVEAACQPDDDGDLSEPAPAEHERQVSYDG